MLDISTRGDLIQDIVLYFQMLESQDAEVNQTVTEGSSYHT